LIPMGIEKMRLAQELAEELDNKQALVRIMQITAELQARADHYTESEQYFNRAIDLADEIGEVALRCEVRATAGDVYNIVGDMKKAIPYYVEAIDLWPDDGDINLKLICMSQLAKVRANSGEHEAALKTIKEAESLIKPTMSPETRCVFERAHAQVYYMLREFERAATLSLRALDIAREYDLTEQIAANAHNLGDDYVALGDYRKAFSYLKMSQELAENIGYDIVINLNKIFLSFIDALKFDSIEGLSDLEQALVKANERNTVWEQIQVHYFIGRIHFEHKHYDMAKTHMEQSVRIGRDADNKIYDAQANDVLEQIAEIQDAG
jgi:tetratricopeptide (TPR) repeat protein